MTVSEYNQCVALYSDNLYRFLLKNVRDDARAQDLVQDTFEKLWRKVEVVDFKKAKSYLFTAGYHTMIDGIRRAKKQGDFNEVSPTTLSIRDGYSDLNEILHEALDQLPEVQKSIILLRDYEGYSYKEIGEMTGLSESQVKVYIYRGRVALKKYLVKVDYVI